MDLPDSPTHAQLDEWAEAVRILVTRTGFDATFKSQCHNIAHLADRDPDRLSDYVQTWCSADERTSEVPTLAQTAPPASKQDFLTGADRSGRTERLRIPDSPVPGVHERDGTPVKVYNNEIFKNWGGTRQNTPSLTFVPKTKIGVVNIVRHAIKNGMRVRAAGARHSWSAVYGKSGDILISMMELAAAVPATAFGQPIDNPQDNELEAITFEGEYVGEDGKPHARIRLGAATTSEHFRQWAVPENGKWEWMLPALPVLTAITSAGWTQVMCHGAGIKHPSLSDFCTEIEFVNCKGNLQVIKDRQQLRAAAGCFGLIGIIVSHVFEADPLKIARFFPQKVPTPLAVPPITRGDVPKNDDFDVSKFTDSELAQARAKFQKDCQSFYSEWLWCPFQEQCFVNVWDTEPLGSDRPRYPDAKQVRKEHLQAAVARAFEVTALRLLPGKTQAELLSFSAMQFLPGDENGVLLRTGVPDALHFRRGIHRMPVRSMEFEIEIPLRSDGAPDFGVCQKAWWLAIAEVYAQLPNVPMRTALEMRIVGGSDTFLAPNKGNEHGTCSIEVITNTIVSNMDWFAFLNKLAARWGRLVNPVTKQPLRFRPHFGKQWPRQIRGRETMEFLKYSYADDITAFKDQLGAAATAGGYTLQDMLGVFGNDTILDLIGETPPPEKTPSPFWSKLGKWGCCASPST